MRRLGLGLGMGPSAPLSPMAVTGCVFWFEPDQGVTLTGGAVSAWSDLSGSGHSLSQGTSSKYAVYASSGGPGNRPYVSGDGASKFLAASFTLNQAWEIFAVAKWNSGSAGTLLDGGALNKARIWQSAASKLTASSDGQTDSMGVTGATLTAWNRYNVRWNGTSSAGALGSTAFAQQTGTGLGTNAAGGLTLFACGNGTTDLSNTSITSLIGFGRILTTTERAFVNAYLTQMNGVS